MNRRLVALCGLLVGCTFGGSEENPSLEIPTARSDASVDASAPSTGSEMDPPVVTTPEEPSPPTVDAGGVVRDARAPVGPDDVDASGPEADAGGSNDRCEPSAPVVGCDPVENTGCAPLTQCDIEPSAATATGRCVFPQAPPVDGCLSSVVSATCAPQSTCVENACRKLCYCDDDCGAGACCTDTSAPGPAGFFKLCAPC